MSVYAPGCEEVVNLAAGYALDALDDDERRLVEEHVERCPNCAEALDRMSEGAGALALGVPQLDPPPELRQRLRAAVQAERQESPPRAAAAPASARSRVRSFRPRLSPVWGAVAAAIVVSAGSLVWAASLQHQVTNLASQAQVASVKADRYDHVVKVLASTQLSVRPLWAAGNDDGQAHGTIYLDPSSNSGMLMVHGLWPKPGYGWQIWFVRGTERVSGGMVWTDDSGTGYAMIKCPGDLQTFESVGLTLEPSSGSAWPTSPKVMGTTL